MTQNPFCSQEKSPDLTFLSILKCVVEKVFDVDERCNEVLNFVSSAADVRERCDRYLECLGSCLTTER